MTTRHVQLLDPSGAAVAVARVADEGSHYGGTVDLRRTPAGLLALFREFEEVVDGQMLVFLDEVQGKIAAHHIRAVFDDGHEVPLDDLQVHPSTGDVSFRAVRPAYIASR